MNHCQYSGLKNILGVTVNIQSPWWSGAWDFCTPNIEPLLQLQKLYSIEWRGKFAMTFQYVKYYTGLVAVRNSALGRGDNNVMTRSVAKLWCQTPPKHKCVLAYFVHLAETSNYLSNTLNYLFLFHLKIQNVVLNNWRLTNRECCGRQSSGLIWRNIYVIRTIKMHAFYINVVI